MDKAIEYAKIYKREHQREFGGVDSGAPFSADELASNDPVSLAHNVGVLIERPQNPAMAFDVLNLLAQRFLREHRAFPPALATWAADVLAGKIKRPSKGAKRKTLRNSMVTLCVRETAKRHGLRHTRKDGVTPESACDAVAKAWSMPYKTVADIWNKRTR